MEWLKPIASNNFFFEKEDSSRSWYETHDNKFLAIIEAFKTWKHYLKDNKYKVLMFIDHNNL